MGSSNATPMGWDQPGGILETYRDFVFLLRPGPYRSCGGKGEAEIPNVLNVRAVPKWRTVRRVSQAF